MGWCYHQLQVADLSEFTCQVLYWDGICVWWPWGLCGAESWHRKWHWCICTSAVWAWYYIRGCGQAEGETVYQDCLCTILGHGDQAHVADPQLPLSTEHGWKAGDQLFPFTTKDPLAKAAITHLIKSDRYRRPNACFPTCAGPSLSTVLSICVCMGRGKGVW